METHTLAADTADLVIDAGLIRKYGGNGPRYTSYPTADRFVEAFDARAYGQALRHRRIGGFSRPLSLYVHLPFCESVCYYCACNKIVTRDRSRAVKYLEYIEKEVQLVAGHLGDSRSVGQIHLGGGTPTFLDDAQLASLCDMLRSEFEVDPWGELAIEIDPRRVDAHRMAALGALGFNRVSFGVQDFDPAVQRAVHRIQGFEETRSAVRAARNHGFRSVNVDLIYGLPRQTVQGFSATLERVVECDPDRIALYSYAHLPQVFKPQRRIEIAELPDPTVKLAILTGSIERLQDAGFVYIGMDHFAKPEDELAVAQREGRLTRNFQGYSAHGDADIIGLGVSAIGKLPGAYSQNDKDLEGYYARLDARELPVQRGVRLSPDDLLRRAVIESLACHFRVSKEAISLAYLVDFDDYFADELRDLARMEREGLVSLDDEWITVTPRGRLIVRAVCMVFDRYLRQRRADEADSRSRYSRVV